MATGNPAVDWLIYIAAGVTAIGVIWRKFLGPIVYAARKAEEALPVIMDIAQEFRSNGGSSLRDIIEDLRADASILSDYAHNTKHDTVNRLTVVAGHQDLLMEEVAEIKTDVAAMKEDLNAVKIIVDPLRGEPQ